MRTRLLPLLIVLMAGVLLALGFPLAASLAAAQQQRVVVDRIDDTARFAALAQFVTAARRGQGGSRTSGGDTLRTRTRPRYHAAVRHPGRRLLPRRHAPWPTPPTSWQLPAEGEAREAFERGARRPPQPRPAAGVALAAAARLAVASPVVRDGDVVAVVVTDSPTGPMRSRILHGWLLIGGGRGRRDARRRRCRLPADRLGAAARTRSWTRPPTTSPPGG